MTIFSFSGALLETVVIILVGTRLNNINIKKSDILKLLFVSTLASIFILLVKPNADQFLYLISVITFVSSFLALSLSIPFLYSLFSIIFGCFILIIFEFFSISFINAALESNEVWHTGTRMKAAIIHSIFMFLLYLFLKKNNLHLIDYTDLIFHGRKDNLYIGLVFLLILLISTLPAYFTVNNTLNLGALSMLVIILLIILSLYIIKIIFLHESSKIKSKYTQIIERESSNFISTIRSQRHDFVFHLNTLSLMSKQGKYHEINEYIEGITDEVNTINNILPLHSVSVSGLLLYYIEYAKKAFIDFQLEIEDNLKDLPMKDYEINQVLGNLLKNAFEHIEEHPELRKEIIVRISCQSSHYVISVRNPGQLLPDELNQLFLDGYSKKKNRNNEGNGLFSVKRIVDRYNGEVYPELTDEDIEFYVIIPAGSADER